MTPNEYCENKLQQSGSSFYYSFVFLNPEQKQAMIALYAFCREVDDIVDSVNDVSVASAKLNWWKTEIGQLFIQKATHPISKALQQALQLYPLEQQYFLDIISGMEMDLHFSTYVNFEQLAHYCYCAAGAVGLLTIEILGYAKVNQASVQSYAKNLGTALQLTNILRDIKEDLQRQRVYIPQEDLSRFNCTIEMIKQQTTQPKLSNENIKNLLVFQAQRAESFYQQAFKDLPDQDRYPQRMGLMMAEVYAHLLQKIKQQNYPVLQKRVALHPLKKLWVTWKTARREEKYRHLSQLEQHD